MPFKYTYEEILNMVRRNVLDVNVARAIVRRAGLRPGGASAGHTPILSVCPPGGPCPRPPYPSYTASLTFEERDAYHTTLAAAESGNTAALEDMRQYLVDFGLESTLVIDGVMPLLGYDYDGEVFTYQLDSDNGCITEVDITPPANGFWEQYKGGDTRFTDTDTFLFPEQDLKFLLKSFTLRTGEAFYNYPQYAVNLNQANPPLYAGGAYAECTLAGGPQLYTHYNDGIFYTNVSQTLSVKGFIYNTQFSTTQPPSTMEIWLTSDRNLNNAHSPTIDVTGTGNGPERAVTLAGTDLQFLISPYTRAGFVNLPARYDRPYAADSLWRECGDSPETLPETTDLFVAFQSFQPRQDTPVTSTTTWEDTYITKKDYSSTKPVNWTSNPPAGQQMVRYDNSWPTFDVVAVRMYENKSVNAGQYFFPSDVQYYLTKWDVSKATQVRMTAVVEEATAAGATISPIWATSAADIRFQNWSYLGTGVSPTASGFYTTEWEDLPVEAKEAGDIYVAFILEVDSDVEILEFGLAEIHIR